MDNIRHGFSAGTDTAATHADPPTAKPVVLLVDPDKDNRQIYATWLRHCGYGVLEAKNGVEGILLAREHQPDVIVTELFVPTTRGWKVPEVLKRDPRTAKIPILALTAYAFATDEERAWSAGCDGFLSKPCEPSRVAEEVRRLVAASRGAR